MLVVLLLGAVVASGCGGDNGDDGPPPRPTIDTYDPEASTVMSTASITKAQFIQRMNKTCREAWATVYDNWKTYSRTQDLKLSKQERVAEAIELSLLAGVDFHIFDNFRFLGAPPGEEREIERIIGPFQIAVELGWKKIEPVDTLPEVAELFSRYSSRAKAYGLEDCVVDEAHLRKIDA